jgi:tetratricopeptide (TPR) repeat protein
MNSLHVEGKMLSQAAIEQRMARRGKATTRRPGGIALLLGIIAAVLLLPQFYGQAESRDDHRRQLRMEAVKYMGQKGCDQKVALSKFQAIVEDDPSHPENDEYLVRIASLLYAGDSYGSTSNPEAAIEVLNAVIEKYPPARQHVLTAKFTLGLCYLRTKQYMNARKAFEEILDLDTSGEEWVGIRESSEALKFNSAQAYPESATVPGDPSSTLRNLAEMREKYRNRPDVLKAFDAEEKAVQAQAQRTASGAEPRSNQNGQVASGARNSHRLDSGILQMLSKIPKRKEDLHGMGFDRVEVAGVPASAVLHALVGAGVPITYEDLGDDPTLDFLLSDATVDDVLRAITQRDSRYEARKVAQGCFLVPKDSPLGRVTRRFETQASSHLVALKDIADQLQESLGSQIPVKYASVGSGMPHESPASISVDGKVYEALDRLIQTGEPWLWNIRWQIDGTLWLFLTPYPKHRGGRATYLTVMPDK